MRRLVWMMTAVLGVGAVAAEEMARLPHPRLWLTRAGEAEFRKSLQSDPLQARMQAAVMAEAEKILTQRTCRYEIPDGKRLLLESRLAIHNVMFTAWAWRFGGGEKFRTRAIAELDAACALKDWNPSHFLDTAEMATAVATGYDWLHPTLDATQSKTYERAIIEKALKPAKAVYDKDGWWSKPSNNWAQVCGAGIALAAAAVAGNDEGLSEMLFKRGHLLVEQCGKFYQPDGMYPEGPGYWQYGTSYHTALLGACGPLGVPVGKSPELRLAGLAMLHLTSPSGLTYNFADGSNRAPPPTSPQCLLARQFSDAGQAAAVRSRLEAVSREYSGHMVKDRFSPLAVLWLPKEAKAGQPPLAAVFRGEQAAAMFRSGWQSKDAYLAIKGGTPAASHGHMDVGSFVYDAHGLRWFHDMGADNYNLPGYFGRQRWSYYRLQNRSHNTLEIGGALQNAEASPCPVTTSMLTGPSPGATFDLTSAYAGSAGKVTREVKFDITSGRTVLTDLITRPSGDVVWRAFTDADIEVKGDTVKLRVKNSAITLRRLSTEGVWSVEDARPPTSAENPNEGFRVLALTAKKAETVSLIVEITP